MQTYSGYRSLLPSTVEKHQALMRAAYPWASFRRDAATGLVGFWVVVQTARGNRYGVWLPYHREYPAGEPRARVTPTPPSGTPHVYADGTICVHAGYDSRTWTPIVGVTAVRAWLEWFEDYRAGSAAPGGSRMPSHIRSRLK